MSVLFLEYPKCSTCKKAKAWLEGAGVDFIDRHERRGTVCPFGYQRHAGETSPHHRR